MNNDFIILSFIIEIEMSKNNNITAKELARKILECDFSHSYYKNQVLTEVKTTIESTMDSLQLAADSFISDPPDTDYQRGYQEALNVVISETMSPLVRNAIPKIIKALG